MTTPSQLTISAAHRDPGTSRRRRSSAGKSILALVIEPVLRLHRYRNARDRILDEALSRRYCRDQGVGDE